MSALQLKNNLHVFPRDIDRDFNVYRSSTKYIKALAGSIGLFLVSPISLIGRAYLCKRLGTASRTIKKDVHEVYSMVPRMSESEKIDAHLQLERLRNATMPHILRAEEHLSFLKEKSLTRLFYNKMSHHLSQFKKTVIEAEDSLKKAAYPEYQRHSLSSEQTIELKKMYESSGVDLSDWDDEELDVYEQHYKL